MITYERSIHFIKGNLKGLNHVELINFTSSTRAMIWKAGIKRNTKAGILDYELIGFRRVGSTL